MHRRTLGLLAASIVAGSGLWLACGGSDGANDPLTATDTEAGTGLPEAGTKDTSTPPNDAASGTDTGTGNQEAGGGDGGIDPPDAGPGGTTTVINCGSTSCAIPAQTCCIDTLGGGMTAYGCATTCAGLDAGGNGNNDTAALKCSAQANCAAGTVCCVRQVGNNGAASECKATCGGNEAQLCDVTAAVPGCTGSTCSNDKIGDWNLPDTYATCGGKGN